MRYRVTADLDVATFTELCKWVREKRIRKRIVEIEQIEGRTRTRRVSPSRNNHLRLCFDGPDFKFACSRRGNRGFKRHYLERSAANLLQFLCRLLQFLWGKSVPGYTRRLGQSGLETR